MSELLATLIRTAIALAMDMGVRKDKVQAILDAEYSAAEALADDAERRKLNE